MSGCSGDGTVNTVNSTMLKDKPVSDVKRTDQADISAQTGDAKSFKLQLSLPGKDIGGGWLRRNSGDALAYQSYCVPGDSGSVLTPYIHSDGKTYFYDSENNWLSYESIWNLLYMSSWMNAVAWKIEGERLVRVSDGAVLTWYHKTDWPLASRTNWLSAEALSDRALIVRKVEI
jgi:hypothetical protein